MKGIKTPNTLKADSIGVVFISNNESIVALIFNIKVLRLRYLLFKDSITFFCLQNISFKSVSIILQSHKNF